MTQINQEPIPYLDFGGQGEVLHFAHANAYPPGSYQHFLGPFAKQYRVLAMKHRPLWEGHSPSELMSWQLFADDLIRFLDQHGLKNIIGMGHSMGAVATLLAANQRPDLFQQLILIEPVMLPASTTFWLGLLPLFLRRRFIPIAKQALRRRFHWPDQQAMFDHFRRKKVFRRFDDEVLWDYVRAGSKYNPAGGVILAYSREWEAQVYCHAASYRKILKSLQIPALAIRSATTDAIDPAEWDLWEKAGTAKLITIENSGHLVPMERPKFLGEIVLKWLKTPDNSDTNRTF